MNLQAQFRDTDVIKTNIEIRPLNIIVGDYIKTLPLILNRIKNPYDVLNVSSNIDIEDGKHIRNLYYISRNQELLMIINPENDLSPSKQVDFCNKSIMRLLGYDNSHLIVATNSSLIMESLLFFAKKYKEDIEIGLFMALHNDEAKYINYSDYTATIKEYLNPIKV